MITTITEGKRGCGYRKEGGLYLRTDAPGRECGALPIPLTVCPTCHAGIHPSRGWTWIDFAALTKDVPCYANADYCMRCLILGIENAGLLWIGEQYYPTIGDFNKEAHEMGLSRRIAAIPRNFKLGETWVALAHRKAINNDAAGIFHVFKPSRIEYVVRPDDTEEKLNDLEKRGITLVKIVHKGETVIPELF